MEEREGEFRLINFLECHTGAAFYAKHGVRTGDETLQACRMADAVLEGPSGDPVNRTPQSTEAGILFAALGIGLDVYANVQPIKLLPGVVSALRGFEAEMIDHVFVKEHTEGFLGCQDKGVGENEAWVDSMLFAMKRS